MSYCASRFTTLRRHTLEVKAGSVGIGGTNPLRIQSMTTSNTQDIAATVRQSIALAEVGCEIVRITAPNVQAAQCLKPIRQQLDAAGFSHIPLVADIHFLPQAAMEAVEHVEKVRVNPGNYADKKKFAVREYSDNDYDIELQRLHDSFSPLVKRARTLGRCLRIGTNHGSLSDRIMNRYGDTPLGMVESALEFLRIAEANSFKQLILSMKSSNPKVMIQAYRLLVERMQKEDMHYPLHLGVTEAGDGEDGRIKSAIGIGSLLFDGLGDTIRVSLTEDSVYEIPVAQALARKAMNRWQTPSSAPATAHQDAIDPYHFTRRAPSPLTLGPRCQIGPEQPPRVLVRAASASALPATLAAVCTPRFIDTPAEGLLVPVNSPADLPIIAAALAAPASTAPAFLALELAPSLTPADLAQFTAHAATGLVLARVIVSHDTQSLREWLTFVSTRNAFLACIVSPESIPTLAPIFQEQGAQRVLFTLAHTPSEQHATGAYRHLADALRTAGLPSNLWIRNTADTTTAADPSFLSRLLDASIVTGSLLCDGLGDLVSIETEADPAIALRLSYNVLQGSGARISKTEFVSCPSCGRTLFDLQTTTQRIRAFTGHLKGVKLAIMGCIVNGPGEMADADFGYVGGAPGKINLYVGKNCVQYNIPQAEADARLMALIKEHGRWTEPKPVNA